MGKGCSPGKRKGHDIARKALDNGTSEEAKKLRPEESGFIFLLFRFLEFPFVTPAYPTPNLHR